VEPYGLRVRELGHKWSPQTSSRRIVLQNTEEAMRSADTTCDMSVEEGQCIKGGGKERETAWEREYEREKRQSRDADKHTQECSAEKTRGVWRRRNNLRRAKEEGLGEIMQRRIGRRCGRGMRRGRGKKGAPQM
jgi:hypothetical protein